MSNKVGKRAEVEGLNKRIRNCIAISGLTCAEIAKRCGISTKCLYKYCYNLSSPSVQNLVALCSVFNVSADYLLFGKEN